MCLITFHRFGTMIWSRDIPSASNAGIEVAPAQFGKLKLNVCYPHSLRLRLKFMKHPR